MQCARHVGYVQVQLRKVQAMVLKLLQCETERAEHRHLVAQGSQRHFDLSQQAETRTWVARTEHKKSTRRTEWPCELWRELQRDLLAANPLDEAGLALGRKGYV